MTFIWAFIIAGLFCVVAQIIIDNTKLTPGHITSLFTVLGAILAFFGLYDKLIKLAGGGASTIISNFGYLLYKGAYEGYLEQGVLGLFTGLFTYGGAAVVGAVVFAGLVALIFKPKD
ncbi:MAG: SpoVA/SpoVAEb family sporulation membrane protein [Firmicutes bacterium]|nr:SpoVA/SpoVAEb family sporulation membrane protein [Bacillota bacterium]